MFKLFNTVSQRLTVRNAIGGADNSTPYVSTQTRRAYTDAIIRTAMMRTTVIKTPAVRVPRTVFNGFCIKTSSGLAQRTSSSTSLAGGVQRP